MGRVEAFTLEGLTLWINSSDHLPPHFHAKRRGQWEIRVFFLECTEGHIRFNVKWGRKGLRLLTRRYFGARLASPSCAPARMGTEGMQVELNASPPELTVLVHGASSEDAVPNEKGIRVVRQARSRIAERARNLFVLVSALDLPSVAEFVSIANRRHQLRVLLVRDNVDPHWLPQMFERAGLRTLRNTLVHSDPSVPRRVLTAWSHGAQSELIADASVADDCLFVISCALDRYEVPFDRMPALKSIPARQRGVFEVDEDGSYIHWPERDVHVDLDGIRAAIDPEWRARAMAARAGSDRRYGEAIARLRTAKGLKQSDIAGLSERQVRRIEKGEGTTYDSMRLLAVAHGLDLDEYLREVAKSLNEVQAGDAAGRHRSHPASV